MSHDKLSYKSRIETDQVVSYLEELTEGLRNGRVRIADGGHALTLNVADPIEMEVRADKEKKSESVDIHLRWPHLPDRNGLDLQIGSLEEESHTQKNGASGHSRSARSGSQSRSSGSGSRSSSGKKSRKSGRSSNSGSSRSKSKSTSKSRSKSGGRKKSKSSS
jgi:amphi-Trp domain-containing protein